MTGSEPSILLIALVAFTAGVMRGFCGFGGPAFMVAILTVYFTPGEVLPKVYVVDLAASIYLFVSFRRDIPWNLVWPVTIPTLLMMPVGQYLLVQVNSAVLSQAIAVTIALCSILLLLGVRYQRRMRPAALMALGTCAGVVFGATYIALVMVAGILTVPYAKNETRGLIIAWALLAAIMFGIISGVSGVTQMSDYWIALPGAVLYLAGTWAGSYGFRASSETLFRNIALTVLLGLSVLSLVT